MNQNIEQLKNISCKNCELIKYKEEINQESNSDDEDLIIDKKNK